MEESKAGLNITWVIELKVTKNEKEAKHAIEQITKSIQYMQDQASYPKAGKYIKNRDFVFAAVAGAPDKTLPALAQSGRRVAEKLQINYYHRRNHGKKKRQKSCREAPDKIRPPLPGGNVSGTVKQ